MPPEGASDEVEAFFAVSSRDLGSHWSFRYDLDGAMHRSSAFFGLGIYGGPDTSRELSFEPCLGLGLELGLGSSSWALDLDCHAVLLERNVRLIAWGDLIGPLLT